MVVKCMIFKNDHLNDLPTYQELNMLCPKGGKVIYGGGKRKSQSVPYLKKLHSLENSCSSLEKFINKNDSFLSSCEVYLFEDKAALSFILMKYTRGFIGSFMLDDLVIDKLHHINWSLGHLTRDILAYQSELSHLDFYKEKNISDKQLERCFPAYINSVTKFSNKLEIRKKALIDEAVVIFNSGWV